MNLEDKFWYPLFLDINQKCNGAQFCFFENDKMYITKNINGEFITKEAMKDPNYKGNRYDWKENIIL